MTSKERDNAFEPLVRMGLQSGPVQRGAECADAAIVAAFVERELSVLQIDGGLVVESNLAFGVV